VSRTEFGLKTAQFLARYQQIIVHLNIDSEEIITTPEHPFYYGRNSWVNADDLQVGGPFRKADGSSGAV
jgi:hypothetical protein